MTPLSGLHLLRRVAGICACAVVASTLADGTRALLLYFGLLVLYLCVVTEARGAWRP